MSRPGDKCSATWRHDASGWVIRHCGHPTANWPYYAVEPEHKECTVVSHNGHGFRTLLHAFEAVEWVILGNMVVTGEWCADGVRRIIPPSMVGEDRSALPA